MTAWLSSQVVGFAAPRSPSRWPSAPPASPGGSTRTVSPRRTPV